MSLVDTLIDGVGNFAAVHYGLLNRIDGTIGARWRDREVTMPEGYRDAYQVFIGAGWGRIAVPEAPGGHGLPGALAAVVMENIGFASMDFSLINMLTPGAFEALMSHGSEALQADYLRKLVSGEWNGTMNLTEPQAGSDVGALRTFAPPTCTLILGDGDDCHGWLIGSEHEGMRCIFTMMNNARLNVGLQGGAGGRGCQPARVPLCGTARASWQVDHRAGHLRRMLLRMRSLTQAERALIYYAAGQGDCAHGGDALAAAQLDFLTPLAKAWGTDVGCEVASFGVQVHGGMGLVEEKGAAQFYRDSRTAPIYERTNGNQAEVLVNRKLGSNDGATFGALLSDMRADCAGGGCVARIDRRDRAHRTPLAEGQRYDQACRKLLLSHHDFGVSRWMVDGASGSSRQSTSEQQLQVDEAIIAPVLPRLCRSRRARTGCVSRGHRASGVAGTGKRFFCLSSCKRRQIRS